jgi:hypothetical protein
MKTRMGELYPRRGGRNAAITGRDAAGKAWQQDIGVR